MVRRQTKFLSVISVCRSASVLLLVYIYKVSLSVTARGCLFVCSEAPPSGNEYCFKIDPETRALSYLLSFKHTLTGTLRGRRVDKIHIKSKICI